MLGKFREYLRSTTSLEIHQIHGYRNILYIMLEKYENLGEIDPEHLEPHERDALQKFKEFEKVQSRSEKEMPVFS